MPLKRHIAWNAERPIPAQRKTAAKEEGVPEKDGRSPPVRRNGVEGMP